MWWDYTYIVAQFALNLHKTSEPRRLLLGRKVMTNLDSVFKSRDITLPTKVCLVKAMVFPVVMYGCESWILKKAECRRIDAFELECWRRLLRVPWIARRSNQFILKEISPGCSLEGMMLPKKHQSWNSSTLATSCEELTHWKRLWCWEGLGAGGEGDDRGWDGLMASLTRWMWLWVNSRSWWWTGRPGVLQFMGLQRIEHNWATELNWVSPDFCSIWSAQQYSEAQLQILNWLPMFQNGKISHKNPTLNFQQIWRSSNAGITFQQRDEGLDWNSCHYRWRRVHALQGLTDPNSLIKPLASLLNKLLYVISLIL